jgi:hypothetical protein
MALALSWGHKMHVQIQNLLLCDLLSNTTSSNEGIRVDLHVKLFVSLSIITFRTLA